MIPRGVEDPRDNLEKATRWELYDFAKAVGCTEVREPMPAMLAVQILRGRGFVNIRIPDRPLGQVSVIGKDPFSQPATQTVDALADMARQFEQEQKTRDIPSVPIEGMKGNELRAECKRRGIPMKRTDTMQDLKAKLNGKQDAA